MKNVWNTLWSEKDIDFFEHLPVCQAISIKGAESLLACHGSPYKNNEKLLPNDDKTQNILAQCTHRYIMCGHTHIQGVIEYNGKVVLNPGAVGVSLHSGGRAQFMILHKNIQGWMHEFISLDYDAEKVIRELQESGLEDVAPHWSRVTKHLILTGEVSHGTVLGRAMQLCAEERENCSWYDIPAQYWEMAIEELMGTK